MKRVIITGFALSSPGTMGGNSKIALELARHLVRTYDVHFVVPESRVRTIRDNIGFPKGLVVHAVPEFRDGELRHPWRCARQYTKELERVLKSLQAGSADILYSSSDFHFDMLPGYRLKRKFGYKWIASQFLFIPSPLENVLKGYRFPVFKYVLVWLYSYWFFFVAYRRADAFVITNDSDRRHFLRSYQAQVFAFYGGVNVEQIPKEPVPKMRDVVFCSRLHPQKGIDGFLDIWKCILDSGVHARLTVIGNGTPSYESYLKAKADQLGVADSIDWLGYVNNEAKYEIYRSAKVMVHPTVFDNNGMVAAEALCSGLPVVMYDLPALRKVYTMGCVKVPFGDKRQFAAEVVKLLADPSRTAPDATQIEVLRDKWNWANRVATFRKFLNSML